MKIKKNDEVIVISGKEKGKIGRILSVDLKKQTVKVDKINIVKKHTKPSQSDPDGGIKEFEAPIHISNVAIAIKSGKDKHAKTRVGFKFKDNKKIRFAKKTGKEF